MLPVLAELVRQTLQRALQPQARSMLCLALLAVSPPRAVLHQAS